MSDDAWSDRRRALEESFFHQRDQELLAKLRAQNSQEAEKQALSAACGITDERVLQELIDADIRGETVAALALVPLVAVAWADGEMDARERKAVLSATESEGIGPASVSYQLLERWLDRPPSPALMAAWKDYVHVLHEKFAPPAFEAFRSDVLGRARNVARSAGGVLGVAAVSAAEQKVLDELEAAFQA